MCKHGPGVILSVPLCPPNCRNKSKSRCCCCFFNFINELLLCELLILETAGPIFIIQKPYESYWTVDVHWLHYFPLGPWSKKEQWDPNIVHDHMSVTDGQVFNNQKQYWSPWIFMMACHFILWAPGCLTRAQSPISYAWYISKTAEPIFRYFTPYKSHFGQN